MKILSLNLRGFGGTSKKLSLKRLIRRLDPDIIMLQETMVVGSKTIEALNYILKDWCISTLDSNGIFGGTCVVWNPCKASFNTYLSSARIVMEKKLQGWNQSVKIINCYGPYSHRKEFWLQILEDGFLCDPFVIVGGDSTSPCLTEKFGVQEQDQILWLPFLNIFWTLIILWMWNLYPSCLLGQMEGLEI